MRRLTTPSRHGLFRSAAAKEFTSRYFDTLYMLVMLSGGVLYAVVEALAITDNSMWNVASLIIIVVLLFCLSRIARHARSVRLALARERDQLEQRVIARTEELEQSQLMRTIELQRFAEFGRLSAHLLHDVTGPLTAASLYLQQIDHRRSNETRQALKNLQQLERYVSAARKQLQTGSQATTFSVQQEMKQLLAVIRPLGLSSGIRICVELDKTVTLYGDPVRFNQIIANLLVNAIDAYSGIERPSASKRIMVRFEPTPRYLQITVSDWGKGISADQLPRIFEPFYTTKEQALRGLGIGLSIVKQSVNNDFHGTICVNSSTQQGTTFTVLLKQQHTSTVQTDDTPFGQTTLQQASLSAC